MSRNSRPPVLADKLLLWFCKNAHIEDLHGDLEETFHSDLETQSLTRAKINYWREVIALITSYSIRKRKKDASFHAFSSTKNTLPMLRNYFIVALRSLTRYKFFTTINVIGLAVGMSISLLLLTMLTELFTFDQFHENKERIYRITTRTADSHGDNDWASAPIPISDQLDELAGIEHITRINRHFSYQVQTENKFLPLQGYYADANFFNTFTFPLISGNKNTALQNPFSMALTESAAYKLFRDEDPINKTVSIDGLGEFTITTLMQDPPKNSHLQFEMLTSFNTLTSLEQQNKVNASTHEWLSVGSNYIYVLLKKGKEIGTITKRLQDIAQEKNKDFESFSLSFRLQPITGIVPGPDLSSQIGPEWSYLPIIIMSLLTFLILVPACFNYTNLSISRSLQRAKEIGLRKVVGGSKKQILTQFLLETLLISFLALLGAYFIFIMVRTEFLSLMADDMFTLELTWVSVSIFILFAILVGLMSGIIPAIYLSRLQPINAMKKASAIQSVGRISFRKVLLVGQFALSLIFIMGVVVVMKQHRYSLNYDLGFQKENILDIDLQGADGQVIKNELSKIAEVQSISLSSGVLGTSSSSTVWTKKIESSDSGVVFQMYVDANYLDNLGLQLLAGSNFEENKVTSSEDIIVNEKFLEAYDIEHPFDAINQQFVIAGIPHKIIGVVKDFNYWSIGSIIEPFALFHRDSDASGFPISRVLLKMTAEGGDDFNRLMGEVTDTWNEFVPDRPLEYQILNQVFTDTFQSMDQFGNVLLFFAILTILIASLGLLGIVIFSIQQKLKEVGIRKVLGASIVSIVSLFSKTYVKLLLLSSLIAAPASFFLMDNWLSSFNYRVQISPWIFVGTSALLLVLSVSICAFQSVKASLLNPSEVLKDD